MSLPINTLPVPADRQWLAGTALPSLAGNPAERRWLTGEGDPAIVIDHLTDQGWSYVGDDLGNAHLASPDRLVYLGFLPEGPDAANGNLWLITVRTAPHTPPAWTQRFRHDVPAELVLAFTAALIATPGRDTYEA